MKNQIFWEKLKKIPNKVIKTYMVIEKLCDNEVGYCFAKNELIGEKVGKHPCSISRDISFLREMKYLCILEIKQGYTVIERRIYLAENYMDYLKDKENINNLKKTEYKIEEGIYIFKNEKIMTN